MTAASESMPVVPLQNLGGYKVIVYDTAGLRTGACDEIERIGISRARDAVQGLPCGRPALLRVVGLSAQ